MKPADSRLPVRPSSDRKSTGPVVLPVKGLDEETTSENLSDAGSQEKGADSKAVQPQLEMAIFHVVVNGVDQGDHFFQQDAAGGIWSTPATLKELEIRGITMLDSRPAGKPVSLADLGSEMTYKLDPDGNELKLNVNPDRLPAQQLRLTEEQRNNSEMLYYNSAFLNYHISYGWAQQGGVRTVSVPLELGMRLGSLFFLSNGDYSSDTKGRKHWTRTQSKMIWDDPGHLVRAVVGDIMSSTGEAGIGGMLGGVTVAREFGLNPYLVHSPRSAFNIMVPTVSDVEVYINGVLIKQEHVLPGPLTLSDPPFFGGRSEVEIVIRDAFGRETRHTLPYYYSSQLLSTELSDFSFSVGVPQSQNARGELNYAGSPVFLGYYRKGLSDWLTAGLHSAYSGGAINAGLSMDMITGNVGEMNLLLSGSRDGVGRGMTGTMHYSLTAWDIISPSIFASASSASYHTVFDTATATQRPLREMGASVGMNLFVLGNVSGRYRQRWLQNGVRRRDVSAVYSTRLGGINLTLSGNWQRDSATLHTKENYALGINYNFKNGVSLTLNGNRNDGVLSGSLQIQLNPPLAEGFGYSLQSSKSKGSKSFDSSAHLIWKNRYNELEFIRSGDRKSGNYTVSGAGALALVGGDMYLSRPINDGFAVVQTGDMPDMPVTYSGQTVGVTNSKGKLLVPNLISYNDNNISIDPGNMPMGYQVDATRRSISVPHRSGAVVKFDVHKIQTVEGKLFIRDGKSEQAAAYYGLELLRDGKKTTAIVGYGGAFYIENMPAGRYKARLFNEQKECHFEMRIPKVDKVFINMGKIVCSVKGRSDV